MCFAAPAPAAEPIQVFVLHSYSQEYPWTQGQHRGFVDTLKADHAREFDLRVEYLDTKRAAYTPAYADLIAAHLREKYQGYQPAAVYVTDDNALSFALTHLRRVFPDAPVFFSGVNNLAIRSQLDPERITGVFEKKEIGPNLLLMRAIAPDNRRVAVVGDASETYLAIEREIRQELRRQPDIEASFVSSGRLSELIDQLGRRQAHFLFLTTLGAVSDRDGRTLTLPETIRAIVEAGNFVVFSMEDAYLFPGVLGGYVTSGPGQGRVAAGLLLRHLGGEPMSALRPVEVSPNEYIFDQAELDRAGLALPAGVAEVARLVNVPPTFYESNRRLVLGALYILIWLVVVGLIVALIVVSRKNRLIVAASSQLAVAQDGLNRAQMIARMGNWDWRIPADRVDWSDASYRVFGVERGRLGGSYRSFLDSVHPDDRAMVERAVEAALERRAPFDIQHRIVRPDGEVRIVHESAEILRDPAGAAVRMVGSVQDITERKAAESALRESEERLHLFIEHAPASLAMFDREMRYLAASRRWRDDYGLGDREIVGRCHYDVFPTISERWRSIHRRGLDGEVVRADEDRFEREDGSLQWLRWEVRPWHTGGGGVGGIVIFTEDITRFRQASEEIRKLNAELEARVAARTAELVEARNEAERLARAKSEFLANMSHEIRTPLNAVLGFARIGARNGNQHDNKVTFDRILAAGEHLLAVINDILDISKIEVGKLELELRPFELGKVIANAVGLVSEEAQRKGLGLAVDLSPDLPGWVSGDPHRLQQILVNLLSNAVKFTEHGSVSLLAAPDGALTRIAIADSGIGMSQEQLARVFVPFEQADTSTTRRFGGTGLGLAISHRLACLMGGGIEVDSAPGRGSTFTLVMSLPPAEAPGEEAQRRRSPLPTEPRLSGISVLAAEDVAVNRLILEDLLVHEGARVSFAENGLEVLELLAEHGPCRFDVVLMDVQMPKMDGLEATRRLLAIAPHMPVIGLTAQAMAEERERCISAGMVEHLAKPIDEDKLVATILSHVAKKLEPAEDRPPQTPAIDWEGLRERFGHRQGLLDRLAAAALASHAETSASLRAAIEQRDLAQVAFVAHAVKGVAGNLMANSVHALAIETERSARAGEGQAIELAIALGAAMDEMMGELEGQ